MAARHLVTSVINACPNDPGNEGESHDGMDVAFMQIHSCADPDSHGWHVQASHQDAKHAFLIANQTTHVMAGRCCAGNSKKMDAGIYCVENVVVAPLPT